MMAPRGRGPSNGWTRDHAQQDVAEAIADVLAHHPVDPDRVVLTRDLVADLRAAGAAVEFVTEPGAGHEAMGPAHLPRLHRWLRTLLGLPDPS